MAWKTWFSSIRPSFKRFDSKWYFKSIPSTCRSKWKLCCSMGTYFDSSTNLQRDLVSRWRFLNDCSKNMVSYIERSFLFFLFRLRSWIFLVHQIVSDEIDRVRWSQLYINYRYLATSVNAWRITGTTVASRYCLVGSDLRSFPCIQDELLLTY